MGTTEISKMDREIMIRHGIKRGGEIQIYKKRGKNPMCTDCAHLNGRGTQVTVKRGRR